jgi:hypothetical protein
MDTNSGVPYYRADGRPLNQLLVKKSNRMHGFV